MTGGGAGGAGDSESPATAGNGDCADSTDTPPNSRIPEGLLRLPAIPFNGLLGGGGGDAGDSSDSGDAKGSEAGDSADGDSNSNKARGVGGRLRNLRVGGPRRWGNNVEPAAAGGGGAIGGRERGGATTAPAPPSRSGGKSPKLDEGSGRGKGGTSGVGLEPAGDDGVGIPGQIGDALRGWAGAMTGGGGGYDSVRSVSVAAAGDPVEYEDDLAEFIEDVGEDGDIGEGGSVGSSDNGRRRWGRGLGGPNWWG